MKNRMQQLTMILLLTAVGCSDQTNNGNKSNQDLIQALVYHHDFKVSAIVDELIKTDNIDKKIPTERVASTPNFWTPLSYASFIGNLPAVKLLVKKRADVNYKDANGQTPLILAAISGNIEAIEILLQAGADINATDINSNTALIHASSVGNTLTVKYLVEKGCDLTPAHNQQNALDFALFYQHKEIIDYLKSKGLSPSTN